MKVPPKKPHFFKPILPGFKHGFKIPIGFLNYLKGYDQYEHAILRRADKKWLVKVKGGRFEEGNWKDFVEQHDLQLGDILVFKHERDMIFEVSIFDSSHCDREYMHEEDTAKKFDLEDLRGNASLQPEGKKTNLHARRVSTGEKPKHNIGSSDKVFSNVKAAKDMPLGRPHFTFTIKPHCISKSLLHIPKKLARANGLSNRNCTIMIRDEQRSWAFKLYYCAGSTFIGGGWREFCAANFLKEGDHTMLETISKGEKPILKFYDLRENASLQPEEKKPNLDAKRVSTQGLMIESSDMTTPTSAKASPHFISTIFPYSISRSYLCLPIAFAKSNSLMNRRKMILTDEKQRSWSVQLKPRGKHFAITRGLEQFMKANGVQAGDTYKFELINNGTIPVAYFHCKYSGRMPSMREALDKEY
ncbi:B3 domain-containing protein REM10-like isoform X2 [Lycium barbarum]|uniref:B3 domain-containing protein REM10-like isoform X2 n=1 Tax=Lycium barbarum TaxID=112863 RepID=UPI00293E85C4|nr:B3 domain-containing protein REM10-like isoform X2 [Lycium barbarum]